MASERKRVGPMMSFMDLLSCGMGGAIVLALINSVIKYQVPEPVTGEYILVEVRHDPAWHVGIEIERDRFRTAMHDHRGAVVQGVSAVDVLDVAESIECWSAFTVESGVTYCLIEAPAVGRWVVRPYLVDYRNVGEGSFDGATRVRYWTRHHRSQDAEDWAFGEWAGSYATTNNGAQEGVAIEIKL